MAQVLELLISWIVTNGFTFLVIVIDERKVLSEAQLERAWPPSSRDSAIVGFGPLALPFHFVKTRGSFKSVRGVLLGIPFGLLLGVVAFVVVILVSSLFLDVVFWALGFPDPG